MGRGGAPELKLIFTVLPPPFLPLPLIKVEAALLGEGSEGAPPPAPTLRVEYTPEPPPTKFIFEPPLAATELVTRS